MGVVGRITKASSVVKDAPDLRDQIYLPTLRPLPSELRPDQAILQALLREPPEGWLPRAQGDEGTCTAQAIATLIDLQRLQTATSFLEIAPVSARMLYEMAIQQNYERQSDGVSLRDGIKGFYHSGVCSEKLWRYNAHDKNGRLTIRRAKDARKTSLGAYYRMRPSLNDYHAALNDVGPLLVSAGIHEGWSEELVRRHHGRIDPAYLQSSAHAFVIVGYDSTGFLVLNSWGRRWGRFMDCPGLAHWRYEDWADNVFDGWALRLGVSAPAAFSLTIGEQGIFLSKKPTATASIPAYQVRGHLIHLDDGRTASRSRYPYEDRTIAQTCGYLRLLSRPRASDASSPQPGRKRYRGIVLKLCGSLLGLDEIAQEVNREKAMCKRHSLYLLAIAWCNDFVEKTSMVLSQMFSEATKQIDTRGDELDAVIEGHVRGVGRAIWRDIERASTQSAAPSGPLCSAVSQILRLKGLVVHIVTDGAGAMLLCELMAMLEKDRRDEFDQFRKMVQSVDLVAPTISAEKCAGLLGNLGNTSRFTVHVPSADTESRLGVGMYSKSMLHLIENSFCSSEPGDRPDFIGKAVKSSDITRLTSDAMLPKFRIEEISVDAAPGQVLAQSDLYAKGDLLSRILDRISPISIAK